MWLQATWWGKTKIFLQKHPFKDVASFADIECGESVQEWLENVAFVAGKMCDPNELQTFQQTWWDLDKNAREKWCEAIRLEFNKMIEMGMEKSMQNAKKCK